VSGMKFSHTLKGAVLLLVFIFFPVSVQAQFENLLKSFRDALTTDAVSETEIARGLKEALRIGTGNAVDLGSALDGYYRNPDIRIPLPETWRQVEGAMRAFGLGDGVDAFVLSMNRAAERAAPAARDIFGEAIGRMTIDDARRILEGGDNEATLYFREKTETPLAEAFRPITRQALGEVGATRTYRALEGKVREIPFIPARLQFDLDQYVTEKALDGLFLMLAEEEKKIRENPQARVTELLKKVFGSK
jgi:hypothetical protein